MPGSRQSVHSGAAQSRRSIICINGAENSTAAAVCFWHASSRSGALLSNFPSDDVFFKAAFPTWLCYETLFGRCQCVCVCVRGGSSNTFERKMHIESPFQILIGTLKALRKGYFVTKISLISFNSVIW